MSSDFTFTNEEEELSYQVASIMYPYFKRNSNIIMVIQNALLFVSPIKSFIFFFGVNLIFFIFYICHFSIFSHMFIILSIRTIPSEYKTKFLLFINSCFASQSEKEKYFLVQPIPIDHLCCLIAIFYVQLRKFINYYINSVKKAQLFDVAFITVLQFFVFYLIYLMGDSIFVWVTIHAACLVPFILAKRVGFEIFHFPTKIEQRILSLLRRRNEEEEKIEKEEKAQKLAEEEKKAQEEVKRLAEIAMISEETENFDFQDENQKNDHKLKIEIEENPNGEIINGDKHRAIANELCLEIN
ncbi:hypothetical protein TRFO_33470 [Tritrichomonas foetus]|uniref:Transmembrane protein n=1 Tax=Tritrichomonas foetus TaxID=1144522 RepID=A0A1J4JNF2_9EUKA|nr:hypothetical protein TRFO_33470 [Tritrichomonas foetus]|eukprot:OHS99959.1 hypothetical protein TRFO_33470 [Tritrichomonas foetus]